MSTELRFVVGALVAGYELFARQSSSTPERQLFRPGAGAETQVLWQKLEEAARYCAAKEIQPLEYLTAQFEMWTSMGRGSGIPGPRHVGASPAARARYARWRARRASHEAAHANPMPPPDPVAAVLRNRPDLSEGEFFRDPLLVRLVPPEVARENASFRAAVSSGAFEDSLSRTLLKEYLS